MEKRLSFVLMLSLEEMAFRRIAVAMCSERYILYSIGKFWLKSGRSNMWSEIKGYFCGVSSRDFRRTIIDNVSKLQLPESLRKQMLPIIKAVSSEIFTWKLFNEAYLRESNGYFNIHVLDKLCWTTTGAVDYRKTAQEIACSDVLDIVKRFELACFYCLENCIPVLWEELSEEKKTTFCKSRVETPHLQLFLPYILKKQKNLNYWPLNNVHIDLFECSALYGNKTLTEYCFRKLTKEEREASLIPLTRAVIRHRNHGKYCYPLGAKLTEVLCFLLSRMTREAQIRIFNEWHHGVLLFFLDWPWKDLFRDIADVTWHFLPEFMYINLIRHLKLSIDHSGYYFPHLIREFFLGSPMKFRKLFIDGRWNFNFFGKFFNDHDAETIKVIFRHADVEDRARIVSSCFHIIHDWIDNWHVMEVFLREAALSEENKERLKVAFIGYSMRGGEIEVLREKYRRFFDYRRFEFVEETDAIVKSKRSL